jgi:S-methylmethionine-dependent homocysteine/selenocysteine methylase
MAMFPEHRDGRVFLTEGGIETEVMYRHGFELPEFAVFPLLDDPRAAAVMRGMYRRYLDVVASHGLAALIGGLDYRASPDWAGRLGYSASALADANLACIQFLRDAAAEYAQDVPEALIAGIVGPRGDAYRLNRTITEAEAEDYHATQLETLGRAGVDLAWALTLNSVPEAVGVARAATRLGVPLAISLTLDGTARLQSGPTLAEAIEAIDAATGASPAFYSINCSHPLEFGPALTDGSWIGRLRGLRPNASSMDKIALCQLGHLEEGDPPELGKMMAELARRFPQLDIWGGCCGTWDRHLDHIAREVAAVRGAAPS